MDIRGLGYVGINSPNFKEWETWGPKVIGFGIGDPMPTVSALDRPAGQRDDGTIYLRMDDRRWRLAIHPAERDEIAYIGWEMADRQAFAEALETLKEHGIHYDVADDDLALERGVQGMAFFLDPAGYRHEIFWSGYYFEDSFQPGRIFQKGFRVRPNEGMGHVVLMVPELTDELDEFAMKVLGLRIFAGGTSIPITGGDGGRVRTEMYRGRKNLRTHNLVYMEKPGYYGLHHMFIEFETLDDMGRAYDLVQSTNKDDLVMTIGRHQADTFLSFYTKTPSKFLFEVAWGSKVLDDETFIQDRPLHSFAWGLDMVGDVMLDHLKIESE
jgi:2,3-dihydroxybiphenyl 1,2-dioxygenase